jgi:hypothetical protein
MIALTEENKNKLKSLIEKNGARVIAIRLVDSYLKKYTSAAITSGELPDTATFANGVDEVEESLIQGEYQDAYSIADSTAQEMLEDEGFDLSL